MLQPSQPQRWDPVEGFKAPLGGAEAQRELRYWALIAVGALAIAGVFALLLVLGRVSKAETSYPWLIDFYDKFLIVHVIFSFVIWFAAAAAMFMQVAAFRMSNGAPRLPTLGRSGLAAAALSFILLAIPALIESGQPSLNNYVPAIIDPFFYVGLLCIAFATLAPAVRALANVSDRSGPVEPLGATGLAATAIGILALMAFALNWNRAGGMPSTPAGNEDVFWAGGHILQFMNVAIMLGAWVLLCGRALGRPPMTPRLFMLGLAVLSLLALGGFTLQFIQQPFSAEERELFTLYQYALAPVPTVVGALCAFALIKGPRAESAAARTATATMSVSLALFFIGGFLGIFVDGTDTRTPAHYHGVIGAVNVALMGFIYLFVLPILSRGLSRWRAVGASIWLYGIGQILHSVGLFVAGGYGAPRKVAGTSPGFEDIVNWTGHQGIRVGGLIAVIGGVMFIWIAGKRLLQRVD